MHIEDFGKPCAASLAKAIHAAAEDRRTLVLDPREYPIDEPVKVTLDFNVTGSWGVSGFGAVLKAEYMEPDPVVLFDTVGNAVVRHCSLDGFTTYAKGQPGLVVQCLGGSAYFYSFSFLRLGIEGADDALRLEGNVFEGDILFPSLRNSQNALALGNTDPGILSAINVFGGTLSQNWTDGVRCFAQTKYREPYDFSLFGTYIGNNGRYAVYAPGGVMLLDGVRMENPWADPARHDPDGSKEHAAVRFQNFANLQNCTAGGNGNATSLADGYLSGTVSLRSCRLWGERIARLARLDGKPDNAKCVVSNCNQSHVDHTSNVVVTHTP
jgi:hypothetical protein